jgi:hypothetical protein
MILRKPDYLKKKFAPFLEKTLENAVAHQIATEFPRIGGPRMQKLCAEIVLAVVAAHIRPAETIRCSQLLWMAISVDDPPSRGKTTRSTRHVPVTLDLITPAEIEQIIARRPKAEILEGRCVRLCIQACEQGALLSGCDLALILNLSETVISSALTGYEKRTGTVVPRRATVHDVGTGVTHKKIICRLRYLEGKSSEQIGRETFHSLDSVDRYLGDFDRVRHCRLQGLSPGETAHAMQRSEGLIRQYLSIDDEIEKERPDATASDVG